MKTFICINKKRILSLFLVLMMSLSVYTPVYADTTTGSSVAESPQTATAKIAKEKAETLISTYGVTSVQYALIDNGDIVLSDHAGVFSKTGTDKLSKDSMYGIASISKMFATTAVMKLVDMGKINLDTPVVTYIKDFSMADSRYKDITPRMLLNHSSGLMGTSSQNVALFDDADTFSHDNFLDQLKSQRLKADPGAFSVYCNDGFTLAEILVEEVSGLSFTQFMTQYITQPLGLSNTKTPQSTFDHSKLAKSYYPTFTQALPDTMYNIIGAGGIYSTAEDLCNFAQLFMKDSKSILSTESVKAMAQPEFDNGIWPEKSDTTFEYGLGWDSVNCYPFNKYNITALTKGGDVLTTHSSLIVLPDENMAVAVLTSGSSSSANQVMGQEILLSALKEKNRLGARSADDINTNPVSVPIPDAIKEKAGLYMGMVPLQLTIKENNTLTITTPDFPNESPLTLIYTDGGYFTTNDGAIKVKLVEETNGITYLYSTGYMDMPGLGRTVLAQYEAQKITNNEISDNVKQTWNRRKGNKYYLVSEKYSSQTYMTLTSVLVDFFDSLPGFLSNTKIINNLEAQAFVQIPVMSGRDLIDISFFQTDRIDYLKTSNGLTFISEDAIDLFSNKDKGSVTIPKSGYAKWFKADKSKYGKTMTVKLPAKSSFAVYDKTGNCKNNSHITKQNSVKLAQGDTIVFIGSPSAKFEYSFK